MTEQQPGGIGSRDLALDAARALAVFAMVMGHTLHATLSLDVRAEPLVATYWQFRGLTAPLFLLVSGWAVTVVTLRTGLDGVLRRRLPRVLLLLALGYALRIPMWNLAGWLGGDPKLWRHFLAFDALHCVGASLLVAVLILQFVRPPASRTLVFGLLAIGLPFAASSIWGAFDGAPLMVQQSLGGGTAPFPLFPWAGYFFAGALLASLTQGIPPQIRTRWLTVIGIGLVVASGAIGMDGGSASRADVYFARLGQVLLLVALVSLLPATLSARMGPVGRASLGVYVVHLVVVYGWAFWPGLWNRIGRTLDFTEAFGLGLTVFAGSLLVVRYGGLLLRPSRWAEGWQFLRSLRARGMPSAS